MMIAQLVFLWLFLGWLAFRIDIVMSDGEKKPAEYYRFYNEVTGLQDTKEIRPAEYYTPRDGLKYMAGGAVVFVAFMLLLLVYGISNAAEYLKRKDLPIWTNSAVNTFFGTNKKD